MQSGTLSFWQSMHAVAFSTLIQLQYHIAAMLLHRACWKVGILLQQAERCGAERLIIIAPDEWERGLVRVKDLAAREEQDIPVDALFEA